MLRLTPCSAHPLRLAGSCPARPANWGRPWDGCWQPCQRERERERKKEREREREREIERKNIQLKHGWFRGYSYFRNPRILKHQFHGHFFSPSHDHLRGFDQGPAELDGTLWVQMLRAATEHWAHSVLYTCMYIEDTHIHIHVHGYMAIYIYQ